jgi:predicted nucleic acid-binding protein
MRGFFADTSWFLALVNKRDGLSEIVLRFVLSPTDSLVTTDWVLVEFVNAMHRGTNRSLAISLIANLRREANVEIVPACDELLEAGLNLFARRPDKEWSLTDCISFVVTERQGLTEALTADRHFEQAGFKALLLEG